MKNFTIIGLRLLAIWAFLKALLLSQYIPTIFGSGIDEFSQMGGYGILIAFILYLISATILFFKAPTIAIKVSPTSDFDTAKVDIEKLASVLFATAGLLIFFWSINSFLNSINSIFHYRVIDPENVNRAREIRLVLLGGGIQMIFGLSLFIGGKKIAQCWHNFRNWT
ncbi:MAG: hypothetical protein R3281_18235 [Balneolaceae bacterium]|nr:hypothetical protein [Balneolaceae bacterium]